MLRNKSRLTAVGIVAIAFIVGLAVGGPVGAQDVSSEIDCSDYEKYAGVETAKLAEFCAGDSVQPEIVGGARVLGDPANSLSIGGYGTPGEFITFPLADMTSATVLGNEATPIYGMDYDSSATTLWALHADSVALTGSLGTMDPATGVYTSVVACFPPSGTIWTGLTIDSNNVMWASDATTLYTIDPACNITTIGAFNTPGAVVIDIAINTTGQMYAHDIVDDAIYTVDTTTGAATLVGSTGMAAGYAQGMDFDPSDGTLYAWIYLSGGNGGFCTIDLATGAATVQSWRTGEWEGAIAVAASENLGCGYPMVEFEDGIPLTFTVVDNAGLGVVWTTTADAQACPRGNITNGSGEAACVDSDVAGSIAYDTELVSNPFDLSAASAATLYASIAYNDLSSGNDIFEIDIWDGVMWNNVLYWDEDHYGPAEDVSVDISAFAGLSDVQARFTYSGNGYDWYVYMDDVYVACSLPSIELSKTVNTAAACPGTESVTVAPGTNVYYCYDVTNTGNVTFDMHDVSDDQIGSIVAGLPYLLIPGGSTGVMSAATPISTTTVNIGTWDAYQATGGPPTASNTDDAMVIVSAPMPLVCNANPVSFDAGVPPDWTVVNNVAGNPVEWASIADCGESGNFTSGAGEAVCASSDYQGGGAAGFDTELISPAIDLTGFGAVSISYASNYQNFAAYDYLDLDVSTDGGGNWTNVISWNEDHPTGGVHLPPGEDVLNLDLSAFGMQSGVLLRWHYYDPSGNTTLLWYAQLDNIELFCDVPVELQKFDVQ